MYLAKWGIFFTFPRKFWQREWKYKCSNIITKLYLALQFCLPAYVLCLIESSVLFKLSRTGCSAKAWFYRNATFEGILCMKLCKAKLAIYKMCMYYGRPRMVSTRYSFLPFGLVLLLVWYYKATIFSAGFKLFTVLKESVSPKNIFVALKFVLNHIKRHGKTPTLAPLQYFLTRL